MLNAVNNLPRADLQNIDPRATRAKDELFILADLKQTNTKRGRGVTAPYMLVVGKFNINHVQTSTSTWLHDSVATKIQRYVQ